MSLFHFSSSHIEAWASDLQKKIDNISQRISQMEGNTMLFQQEIKAKLTEYEANFRPNVESCEKVLQKYLHSSQEETRKIKITTEDHAQEIKILIKSMENVELQLSHVLKALEILTNNQMYIIQDQLGALKEQHKKIEEQLLGQEPKRVI